MTNDSLIKVESIAECSLEEIWVKRLLKNSQNKDLLLQMIAQ